MSQNLINTTDISKLLNTIRAAELSGQKEVRLPITDAKSLASTLGLVMTRLSGNYETLLQKQANPDVTIKVDGGSGWG